MGVSSGTEIPFPSWTPFVGSILHIFFRDVFGFALFLSFVVLSSFYVFCGVSRWFIRDRPFGFLERLY
jgi:hypothetical protein